MQSFLTGRFILAFIFIGVVSAGISALLFSPQVGFLNWVTGFFSAMTPLRFFGVAVTILAPAGIGYVAARIGSDPIALGLVPAGTWFSPVRPAWERRWWPARSATSTVRWACCAKVI